MSSSASTGIPPPLHGREGASGSPTRGFLFADLRDYTRFLVSHGAPEAAALLVRFRSIVRDAVAAHDGAEIKTEGDSFYVIFPAVSDAVLCGLAIIDAAKAGPIQGGQRPIPVGVGINAGETVETPDGFVGSAVNIAARICAIAKPGEVLVSDTVRALTQTVVRASFEPRGRRSLKGLNEPIAVFAVARSADAGAMVRTPWIRNRRPLVAALAVGLSLAIVGGVVAWNQLRPQPGLPAGPWTIGLDMPLVGESADIGTQIRNAVQLAIEELNATGGIGGSQLVLDSRNNGADVIGGSDPALGTANVSAFVADPMTVAVIGTWSSRVALEEIPITNAAGLLQCSPANTWPELTKPRNGALDLRAANPDRINFIRTAPADDIQAVALASFLLRDLAASQILLIDDGAGGGLEIARLVNAAYERLGGSVIRRTLNEGAPPSSVLDPLSLQNGPTAVFFGGFTHTGAAAVRRAMVDAGKGAIPFLSWDGIQDGSGADANSFINEAGAAAQGSYFSHAAIALPKADFVEHYRARFGAEPIEYAAAGYACAQVIFDALRAAAEIGTMATQLREAVRAYSVDPAQRHDTVIGTVGFDANGDSLQQFVTFYRVDPSAAGGLGDWVIYKQQDYGPAP